MEIDTRLWIWLNSKDTGMSSIAIASRISGLTIKNSEGNFYPHDTWDLGRCIRLVRLMGWEDKLECMAISQQWRLIIDHWAELNVLYDTGPPDYEYNGPLNDRLHALLKQAEGK
jgi:hypothetical protein